MDAHDARVRMLRLWLALGENADASNASTTMSILTTQRTVVHAHALVPNAKQSLFGATHLVTPLGSYPHAVLRDEDVVLIETSVSHEQLRALLRENSQLRGSS